MPSRSLCLTFLAIAAAGCQSAPDDRPPVFVGAVDGSDALIALAPEGNAVVAYVCAEQTWAEHSGWFFTELENDAEGVGALKPATSASGHTLENVTVTEDQATGTVRFADGTAHGFTAPRADPRTSAGLYESHASEGQAGLIITNDGRAAGAVRAPTGTDDDPPLTGSISVNQPVGSGTSGVSGIKVTIPHLGTRTLELVNVSTTTVARTGPTLYILVHGMNHPVGSAAASVDTPAQSRTEWHLDFIQGLLGGGDPAQSGGAHLPMFNFAGDRVTQENFMSAELLPTFDAFTPDTGIARLDTVAKHFITLDPAIGDARRNDENPLRLPRFPMAAAFITYRDASGGLVESGKRIANEAYVAIRWYELHFRRTPKIVFLTQSFGGVTARFVLSNPTQALVDLPGSPSMNADRITITAEDRRRMDYVRDRIMYLVTMGTPHEGSFMGDLFVPLQQVMLGLSQRLETGTSNLQGGLQSLADFVAEIDDLTALALNQPQSQVQNAADTLQVVKGALAEVTRNLNGRALRDLTHPFWQRVNTLPLNPARARRTAASPIPRAGGQLIPVYAAGARTPGGLAFTAPELSAFTRLKAQNPKEQEWMLNTMMTDIVIHTLRVNQSGFGRSDQGIYAGFDGLLDRRQRLVDGSAFARQAAQSIAAQVNPYVADALGDGDAVEAVLRPVMGRARLFSVPVYLARQGSFDLGGSVELEVPRFVCTADDGRVFAITLDLGRLLRAMVTTYGSLGAARQALQTQDLNGVLQALAIASDDASDVAAWFLEKYNALAVPEGRCRLPNDVSFSSLFAALNLGNWDVTTGRDSFPAPRWVSSNAPASDDEIDDDGVVGFESAVGFSLGSTTPLFFDHTRNDAAGGLPGSWYRIFDSPLERECHGMQHQWNIGQWARQTFANAGPVPAAQGTLSVFP